MRSRVAGAVIALGVLGSAGAASAASSLTPANCGARPDQHKKWEVDFGTEKTLASAQKLVVRAKAKGFKVSIEVESCTAHEVATARFPSHALANAYYLKARAAGFHASQEES